ncbi:MAG: hypothetical protein E7173_00390 [Firmicutes bacterium]|nr:hypothetical protein [Bacillota bacterium]
MKVTFTKFNETANYYSRMTRTTGDNAWNQDEIQRQFTSLISDCDLTKEQITSLESFMVSNNRVIDMTDTKNMSATEFSETARAREISIQKSKAA